MTKTEMRAIAKEAIADAIGTAYYKISDRSFICPADMTDEEADEIIKYVNQYGTAACKAIGRDYITY